MPPEEDRPTSIDNMHRKFGEVRFVRYGGVRTDKKTDKQIDTLVTKLDTGCEKSSSKYRVTQKNDNWPL